MSKTLARALAALTKAATAWQPPMRAANTRLRVAGALRQVHAVATAAGPVTFVSTHPQALDYPAGLHSREPDTIAWLDGLGEGDVLWDIGANIGAYTLYAARRGARVWAFEPAPASFAALSENVHANRLHERIWALPIAFGRATGVARLAMEATNPGSVHHTLGGEGTAFTQAVLGFSVDEFRRVFAAAEPTHIKLDVDGIEPEIVAGAVETLSRPGFRSLLVEMDAAGTDRNRAIRDAAGRAGLALVREGEPDPHGTRNGVFERTEGRP